MRYGRVVPWRRKARHAQPQCALFVPRSFLSALVIYDDLPRQAVAYRQPITRPKTDLVLVPNRPSAPRHRKGNLFGATVYGLNLGPKTSLAAAILLSCPGLSVEDPSTTQAPSLPEPGQLVASGPSSTRKTRTIEYRDLVHREQMDCEQRYLCFLVNPYRGTVLQKLVNLTPHLVLVGAMSLANLVYP